MCLGEDRVFDNNHYRRFDRWDGLLAVRCPLGAEIVRNNVEAAPDEARIEALHRKRLVFTEVVAPIDKLPAQTIVIVPFLNRVRWSRARFTSE